MDNKSDIKRSVSEILNDDSDLLERAFNNPWTQEELEEEVEKADILSKAYAKLSFVKVAYGYGPMILDIDPENEYPIYKELFEKNGYKLELNFSGLFNIERME